MYSRKTNTSQEGIVIEHDLKSGAEREVFRHKNLTRFVPSSPWPGAFGYSGRFIAVLTDPSSKLVTWLAVSLEGKEQRELIRAGASESLEMFTVSPDGGTVFVKKTKGAKGEQVSELWRVRLDGAPATLVDLKTLNLQNLSGGLGFSIHPDGKQVAFVTRRAAAQVPYEVWVLENFLQRR
jgi:hypothetical protein